MKGLRTIIVVLFLSLVVVVALTLLNKPKTYAPTQNTSSLQGNLDSNLKALDSIDLNTETDNQLNQLNSDSSSF